MDRYYDGQNAVLAALEAARGAPTTVAENDQLLFLDAIQEVLLPQDRVPRVARLPLPFMPLDFIGRHRLFMGRGDAGVRVVIDLDELREAQMRWHRADPLIRQDFEKFCLFLEVCVAQQVLLRGAQPRTYLAPKLAEFQEQCQKLRAALLCSLRGGEQKQKAHAQNAQLVDPALRYAALVLDYKMPPGLSIKERRYLKFALRVIAQLGNDVTREAAVQSLVGIGSPYMYETVAGLDAFLWTAEEFGWLARLCGKNGPTSRVCESFSWKLDCLPKPAPKK